jgi:predicted Fe-S protein YdhL (DUF1289 family)
MASVLAQACMRDPISSPSVSESDAQVPQPVRALWRQSQRVLASNMTCPSPCISVCRMSAQTQLCEGCWRDLEELRVWGQASDTFKREVWQRIQQRLKHAFPQGLT